MAGRYGTKLEMDGGPRTGRRNRFASKASREIAALLDNEEEIVATDVLRDMASVLTVQLGVLIGRLESVEALSDMERIAPVVAMVEKLQRLLDVLTRTETAEQFVHTPASLKKWAVSLREAARLSLVDAAGENPSDEVRQALGRVWLAYHSRVQALEQEDRRVTPPALVRGGVRDDGRGAGDGV